ncbi:methyltransferase domain-containing protein [Mycolicibacterium moriokaense]|nr:methyltransferase domain-containing protein [Mycolicibacterium moriokaense]
MPGFYVKGIALMNKSTDYHDYIYFPSPDGKQMGEYEEIYRNSAILPWHQDEQANWIDVRLTKEMIRDIGQFDEIHDLGCGTGHYLNLIAEEALVPGGTTYGYDISETACKKAGEFFPNSSFKVLNLIEKSANESSQARDNELSAARLFMIRGTLWHVYPKLADVIHNIKSSMVSGDRLLVVQNFPPLSKEFIGKEVIPNHLALIDHFSQHFVLDRHIWYEDRFALVNDNWFIGIFSLKQQVSS